MSKFHLKLTIREIVLLLKQLFSHFWMEMFLTLPSYDVYISQLIRFAKVLGLELAIDPPPHRGILYTMIS